MRPRSLRGRLIVATSAWFAVAFVIGGVALSLAFRRSAEAAFAARLDSMLLAVIAAIDVSPSAPLRLARPIPEPAFDRPYSGWYWQVGDGSERVTSRSLWDATLPTDRAAPRGARISGPRGEGLRIVTRGLRYPERPDPIAVTVAAPEAELEREIARFDRFLAGALATLAVTLWTGIVVQVRYGLRPFRRMQRELAAIRAGRSARIAGDYPEEVDMLVGTMNEVLDRDAARIARAREHVGNLAHGLKTPLAVVAVEATQARPDGARIAREVGRMAALVDHHVTRAAAAGAWRPGSPRVAVGPVVDELCATILRIHADRGLAVDADVERDLAFAGERQDLEEMLGNLIENAAKWAASRIDVRAARAGEALEIAVDDDGPGLAPDERAAALGRGMRFDGDTAGSGLGLAIANDLATLYGGSLALGTSRLGGVHAALRIPVAADQ
ncbi:MAG: sensor histidine kinase [Deltaproteobacteria bacterium]|nr:sensor histidine kinase [Deltaproteobacteria bacterium]